MNPTLPQVNLGLLALLIILMIWQIFRVNRLDRVRKHFYSMGLKKNLEVTLTEQDKTIDENKQHLADLDQQILGINEVNKNNFQKFGFVRFNPFGEAGNLSFSLALLDGHDNGLVISSMHGREGMRTYAKEIKNGKSTAKLTEEESAALKQILQ